MKVCIFCFCFCFSPLLDVLWRTKCSLKNIVGREGSGWTERWKSKFSNETNGRSSPNHVYTKGPSQSKNSIQSAPIIKGGFQYSISIQFKPGFWLLNLCNQVPKTWPNIWKWISLLWMAARTLMLMPSRRNLGWLPSLPKDHPFLGKKHSSSFIQLGRTPWIWNAKPTC